MAPHYIREKAGEILKSLAMGLGVPGTCRSAIRLLKFEGLVKTDLNTGLLVPTDKGRRHFNKHGTEIYPKTQKLDTDKNLQ